MPHLYTFLGYQIFFWVNEGNPLEPVHFHICYGPPRSNSTKVWVSKSGKFIVCNNASRINETMLNKLLHLLMPYSKSIVGKWIDQFGEISYYC